MDENKRSYIKDFLIIFFIFGIVFFQFLGKFPLVDPDEGRYVEVAREMIELKDFITPRLNYVNYFEKPPLHYWLEVISIKIFGQNEFSARFPGSLCGLLSVLLVYFLGRKLFSRKAGVFASVILGSSIGYFVQGRINLTDMTLTFCLSACLGFFILAVKESGKFKNLYYYLFYVFAALTVLTKGLIGLVFPIWIIFFFLLFTKRWNILKEMKLFTGSFLFLLVCAPWFILVSIKNPEFAKFFFIHEHFQRFLTKTHSRYQPAWFFIPIFILTMLPWSFFVPAALQGLWKERKEQRFDVKLYLVLWAVIIFGFFSLSSSKLIPYILPIFPAVALILGSFYAKLQDQTRLINIQAYAFSVICILFGIAAVVYPFVDKNSYMGAITGIVLGFLLMCQGFIAFISISKKQIRVFLFVIFSFVFVLGILVPHFVYGKLAEERSVKSLSLEVKKIIDPTAVACCYNWYQQSFNFYLERRLVLVGKKDELEFGSKIGDQTAWFIDEQDFLKLWNSDKRVFALLHKKAFDKLNSLVKTPVIVIAKNGNFLVVSQRA